MPNANSLSAPVKRWRVIKATGLGVAYGLFVVVCVEALPFRTGAQALLITNPLLAGLAIWGFCFRRPL